MQHLFIINPKSFRSQTSVAAMENEIVHAFSRNQDNYKIHVSRAPRDAIGVIHKFTEAAPSGDPVRVYAVGGDGVLFDCVNGIVGLPNTSVTHVPYGSFNDFLLSFGERSYPSFRDIRLLEYAPLLETDLLSCGSTHAINCCSIGIEADTLMKIHRPMNILSQMRFLNKFVSLIYNWGLTSAIMDATLNRQKYTVMVDSEYFSGALGIVNIGNGSRSMGGKLTQPDALPNDGMLDVIIYKTGGLLGALRLVRRYLRGKYEKYPNSFIYRKATRVQIRSEKPLPIAIDGETFYETALDVEIKPNAINFVAPYGMKYRIARKSGHRGKFVLPSLD